MKEDVPYVPGEGQQGHGERGSPHSANALATCDICGKQLARQSDMPRHKRLHDPEPDRWMHWCPEPGCDYGSMQRSNLRNHVRKHTGQRLRCPDDSTCHYSTSDKSALLRHRQRKHGYRTKPTASKDRYMMRVAKNGIDSSAKLDNASIDSSSSSPLELATDWCGPCCSPAVSSHQARGAIDETDIWQDDHASPQETMMIRPAESIEHLLEGHDTSRFPVSFVRTRLLLHGPENGEPSASKRCRRRSCNTCSISTLVVYSDSTGSNTVSRTRRRVKVKEVAAYKRVNYLDCVSCHMLDKPRGN